MRLIIIKYNESESGKDLQESHADLTHPHETRYVRRVSSHHLRQIMGP